MSDVPTSSTTTTEGNSGLIGKPWIERYRPKSLQEVSHQTEVVATLQNAVETGRLPHLLFYGPPGSGKVCIFSTCLCCVCLCLCWGKMSRNVDMIATITSN